MTIEKYEVMSYSKSTFLLFLLVLIMSACSSSPDTAYQKRTLRALNGKDFRDTMGVSGNLPLLAQKGKSLYNIEYYREVPIVDPLYIDQFLKPEYRIIALESDEECMVGQIQNLLVDDSLIFVHDGWHNNVFVFNLDGGFLHKIGQKGHARNEYISVTYMSLDRESDRVCLWDEDSQKLLFFDYQGHFLNSEPAYFWFEAIELYDGKRVMLTLPYPNPDYPDLGRFKLTITDDKGKPAYGALPDPGFPKYSLRKSKFRSALFRPMHTYPDGVYYIDILSPDTIWRINEAECVPVLAADFGEPFTTSKTYRKMTNDRYMERINEVRFLRDDFVFTKNFGYVTFGESAIIDLKTGQSMLGKVSRRGRRAWHNLFIYALDLNLYDGTYLFDWDSDQFAIVLYADGVLKSTGRLRKESEGENVYQSWPKIERDNLEKLSVEDNPMIIVGTFKDFTE